MTTDAGNPGRRLATEVPGITGLRFLPDRTAASLVNISATGLLVECSTPLRVGSDTAVLFEGGFAPDTVAGRVARCEVAVMERDGLLRYLIGIEFHVPLALDHEAPKAAAPEAARVSNRW